MAATYLILFSFQTIKIKLVKIIKTTHKIFCLFFLFVLFETKAQQYFFKNYNVENGLPFTQVACTFQDRNGYLWSGGYGGLSRFDGKQFLNFNPKNGLQGHNVNAVCEDDQGDILIGTNKGLSILRGRRILRYNRSNGFENVRVTAFCKGFHHAMYIGTIKGLYIYTNNTFKPVAKLRSAVINCMVKDASLLYVGTDKGLAIYGHNTFKMLDVSNGLPSNKINCVTLYKGFLVIGTAKGLSYYDLVSHKFTNYFIENGLIDEDITSVKGQDDRFLWVGSQNGLLRFDGVQFSYYNIGQDNNSNNVKCILHDREDNMWIGTHNGLFMYRDNSFSTFDKLSGPGNAFIFQIFRDNSGKLWICTESSGIFKYAEGYFKRYGINNGLSTNTARIGLQDHEGRLIFGTEKNVVQFINEKFYEIPIPKELKGPYDMLFLDSQNTLWIGGTTGVVSLVWKNNLPQTKFFPISSKAEYQVYGICEGDNHDIYLGTFHAGLFKLSNGIMRHLSADLKLNEEDFFSLRYLNGKLFSPSLNGLLILDTRNGALKKITNDDGLNSELAYSIEFAENKNALWIGTNQGINKLNLQKYLAGDPIEITSFGKQEGFIGVECNTNGMWEDPDGTLWFGTINGLIKHEPFNFKKNQVENTTVIQNIKLLNEDTTIRDNAVLSNYYNTISFYYRGICLTNPDKVLYQKKLEGLEKEWSKPNNEDYSKYANLAPGKYTFRLRSCNNEGVWNKNETTFSFRIRPPFYLTWWFLLLSSVLAFALIYTVFMLRIYNIKKQQRAEYNRKVEMSKVELKALRSQMNPHFIFNSLNSIQHYIFNSKSDEAIKYLSKFARLVRIILNNSDKPTVTVGEDLEALKLYLELEQMRFEEKFTYEVIVDESVDEDYDIMPPLLMQPYVENAILHGLNPMEVKGKLTIMLNSKNNFLICTIMDNGIGREKSAEIKRTMPFIKHRSLGMKITEDRLKILNEINSSRLSVIITDLKDENNNPTGTKVELFVPLNG